MIPVTPAPEPPGFDAKVRQKGLSAIAELTGHGARVPRRGRRRRRVATREQDIPAGSFPPYWRDALDDLLQSYDRRCAFLALYLEHGTGNPSVDHMLPKSKRWDAIYEWLNYRLCAAGINARKKDLTSLIDPFTCKPGWFSLELVGFQVIQGPRSPSANAAAVNATLELLNGIEFCRAREEYVSSYESGHIDLPYLERRAPFVALELRRQGRLRPGDR
ncbi:MAG: hypothetical protein HS113_26445 [Verrucomicrobiales bacterium]|nr:hypothetical protein [Verrucomicrobiales bacterium]